MLNSKTTSSRESVIVQSLQTRNSRATRTSFKFGEMGVVEVRDRACQMILIKDVEYFYTYAFVMQIASIRVLIATIHNLYVYQNYVKTIYLKGSILVKSLYSLKEVPKLCHEKFNKILVSNRYVNETKWMLTSNFDLKNIGEVDILQASKSIRLVMISCCHKNTILRRFGYYQQPDILDKQYDLDIARVVEGLSNNNLITVDRLVKYLRGTINSRFNYSNSLSMLKEYSNVNSISR